MMKKTIFSVILASLALTASAQFGRNPDTNPDKGYKDTYQGYFTVGVAVNMRNINDAQTVEIIKKMLSLTSAVRTVSRCVVTAFVGTLSSATGCLPTRTVRK